MVLVSGDGRVQGSEDMLGMPPLPSFFMSSKAKAKVCARIVLVKELDQFVTVERDAVYNFSNWPTLVGSKLIVITGANTIDLPKRVMTGQVRSHLDKSS